MKNILMNDMVGSMTNQPNYDSMDIVYLPIEQLEHNPENDYTLNDIEELKALILLTGLKQNLDVQQIEKEKFIVLTGNRRLKALKELVSEGYTQFEKVPCTINDFSSIKYDINIEHKKTLSCVATNRYRKLSDEDILRDLNKLIEAYGAIQSSGVQTNINESIAQAMNISLAKVKRLKKLNNDLIPELKEKFTNKEITFTVANKISNEDIQTQYEILDYINKTGHFTTEDFDSYKNNSLNEVITSNSIQTNIEIIDDAGNDEIIFTNNNLSDLTTKKEKELLDQKIDIDLNDLPAFLHNQNQRIEQCLNSNIVLSAKEQEKINKIVKTIKKGFKDILYIIE